MMESISRKRQLSNRSTGRVFVRAACHRPESLHADGKKEKDCSDPAAIAKSTSICKKKWSPDANSMQFGQLHCRSKQQWIPL